MELKVNRTKEAMLVSFMGFFLTGIWGYVHSVLNARVDKIGASFVIYLRLMNKFILLRVYCIPSGALKMIICPWGRFQDLLIMEVVRCS